MPLRFALPGADMFAIGADVVVIPINARGTASATPGKGGLAGVARRTWPDWFTAYRSACDRGEVGPGGLHVHDLGGGRGRLPAGVVRGLAGPRWIVGVATKDHWKNDSRLEWVTAGCQGLVTWLAMGMPETRTVVVPGLGCGLGGLAWDTVRPHMTGILGQVPLVTWVTVFEPQ